MRKKTEQVEEPKPSNIIKFPVEHKNFAAAVTLEDLVKQATQNKIEFISFMSTEMVDEVIYKLKIVGFDVDNPRNFKDIILFVESLKSLILKTMHLEHDLQDIAQDIIPDPDPSFFEDDED